MTTRAYQAALQGDLEALQVWAKERERANDQIAVAALMLGFYAHGAEFHWRRMPLPEEAKINEEGRWDKHLISAQRYRRKLTGDMRGVRTVRVRCVGFQPLYWHNRELRTKVKADSWVEEQDHPILIRIAKQQALYRLLRTPQGRSRLASSMVQPLRTRRDYQSIARRTFLVEALPDPSPESGRTDPD